MTKDLTVAVAGLGAIGARVVRALDDGIPGLTLTAVSARRADRAATFLSRLRGNPRLLPLKDLAAEADIVVECLPPHLLAEVAMPSITNGRTLIVASAGALLDLPDIAEDARRHGAQIIVPSGALIGFDGLRAAAEAGLDSVHLVTRKPATSFANRVTVNGQEINLTGLSEARCLYAGSVRAAVAAFPVNVNVAAAVSMAGLGPERTEIEVWADPTIENNCHTLTVTSRAGTFTVAVENLPDPENPKSSSLTAFSIIACLRRITAPATVGS